MRILWIPHTGWHIPQRAHLFCRALAERHEIHVTDFIADFKYPQAFFTRKYWQNFNERTYKEGAITVHGVPRIAPALFSKTLRDYNANRFSELVDSLIQRYKIDVVVGSFIVLPPKAPRLIFDVFDDNVAYWKSFGKNKTYADEIEKVESAYFEKADEIVVASKILAERIQQKNKGKSIHWIPNGVEISSFEKKEKVNWRDKLGLQGQIVCVIGNHDKQEEMSRLIEIANQLTGENIQLIIAGRGTALPYAVHMVKQYNLNNVHFITPFERTNAPDLLSAADVGICPYLKTPGAEVGSPMRLLQYSAAGLPVVCTDLAEVRQMNFPNIILVDDNVTAFVAGIRKALEIPRGQPAELSNYDLPKLVGQYERLMQSP